MKFKDWYNDNLKVVGYPTVLEVISEQGKYKDFDVVINVSDEFSFSHMTQLWNNGH